MAEIGVESFAPGHGEEYGAQRHQADRAVRQQELHAIERIDRGQYAGIVGDVNQAENAQSCEPDYHDRPEGGGDACGAARLH